MSSHKIVRVNARKSILFSRKISKYTHIYTHTCICIHLYGSGGYDGEVYWCQYRVQNQVACN